MNKKTGGKRLEKLILSIREPIRGGWMLNAYNQTYMKDVAYTIMARIDNGNHYISVDEEVENTASNEERIY